MVGPKKFGDPPGIFQLAVRFFLETDGEGLDRSGGIAGHHGHDRTRVDAPRKERAERNVGDHPDPDRFLQQAEEFFAKFGETLLRVPPFHVPVAREGDFAVFQNQHVAGRQLADAPKD